MTRVTQLIHDAGKYLLISVYPLPTHPTHNFTHKNGGNLETLPGWPKKLQHNRAQVNQKPPLPTTHFYGTTVQPDISTTKEVLAKLKSFYKQRLDPPSLSAPGLSQYFG